MSSPDSYAVGLPHRSPESQPVSRLSENLNARRLALGLTYEQVWEALQTWDWPEGVKPPSLSVVGHWFNGERRPRKLEHLQGLAAVLRMTLDEAASGAEVNANTAMEHAVLSGLRELSDADAQVVLAVIEQLKKRDST